MPDLTFSIEGVSVSHARIDVSARQFTFAVDEPPTLGGTDQGPNPVEYVLGALAGCLNVMGHMIAGEMGFTIDAMRVHIEGDLDPRAFMGQAPGVRPGYKEIRARFTLQTSADAETLARWAKAVETRCPVSDNLSNATPVTITFEK